jgi:isopentenyl-diphosphate delta-isomerase
VEEVILVDENDAELGTLEKLKAHQEGRLHRAFSIFLFNEEGKMLLQQRALTKYHSPGLWSNACCSHPRKGETVLQAAERRLFEELGIRTEMRHAFSFIYNTPVGQGLIEHEFDHVLTGRYDGPLDAINPEEVHACRWQDIASLLAETREQPERFTTWFLIALSKILQS